MDKQGNGYNIVSLGFFCSVAMELERIGLRGYSLPFDWVISGNLASVLTLIATRFEGFVSERDMYQEFDINPAYYHNKTCDIHFYHDFTASHPLNDQFASFSDKYARRINRFYKVIEEPTIFVRYCSGLEELKYVFEHQQEILELLQSFNPCNRILYVTSVDSPYEIESLIFVEKDANGMVARQFLQKLPQLRGYLEENFYLRKDIPRNIRRYRIGKVKRVLMRIIQKGKGILPVKTYRHDQQYQPVEEV